MQITAIPNAVFDSLDASCLIGERSRYLQAKILETNTHIGEFLDWFLCLR